MLLLYHQQENKKYTKILADIAKQNFEDTTLETFESQFKLIFKVGPRNKPTVHWVVEVSPEFMKKDLEHGGRIFVGWSYCNNTIATTTKDLVTWLESVKSKTDTQALC